MVGNWRGEDTQLSSGTPGCLGQESNACPEPCSGVRGDADFPPKGDDAESMGWG